MTSIIRKVIAVGDAHCGKTSLLGVFMTNEALGKTTPTTFENKYVTVELDGEIVPFSLWSTAGEKS